MIGVPASKAASRFSSRSPLDRDLKALSTWEKSAAPSTVSRTPRETRVNNLQPRDSSSRWMERVTAGWDRHSSLGGGVTRSLALDKHGKSLCGLPTDIVTTAGIAPLGKVSASLLVVGVGTTMNTKKLIRQWKTVIASFCCCAAGVLLIVFVGRFIIGTDAAIAGTPIFAGAP